LQAIEWTDRFLEFIAESFITSIFRDEGGLHEWN
jgi:hypothetical protein